MTKSRIAAEKEVVGKMIAVYCRGNKHGRGGEQTGESGLQRKPGDGGHVSSGSSGREEAPDFGSNTARGKAGGNSQLCPDCLALLQYAHKRLDHCRFGEEKTFCEQCPVHCYSRDMRAKIKEVMRYAGPRMLLHHPFLAVKHIISSTNYKIRKNRDNKKKSG